MGLFDFFRRRQKQRDCVVITGDAVTRVRRDGVEERLRWDDLQEVGIVTTDEGPWQEDVFWILIGSDGKSGCTVPQAAEGADKLLEHFQKLPGFNYEEVIKAMGSTSNAKFTCWKRKEA